MDGDTGVWAMDAEEATLKRAMVACSSRVIVAATTEKLGARGNWQIASLDEIDDLVLTTTAPPALAARFRAAGITPLPLTVPLMSVANRARAEQHATRAAFFIPGFATALWATLVPFAKARTGINDATLGLVLPRCRFAAGDAVVRRAGRAPGCRRVMVASSLLICLTVPGLALAGSAWTLGLVLFVFGAVGAMDCTMNVQAVIVEREARRVMMSGFHAFFSIGGFLGAPP